jgi:hypothetical protein
LGADFKGPERKESENEKEGKVDIFAHVDERKVSYMGCG